MFEIIIAIPVSNHKKYIRYTYQLNKEEVNHFLLISDIKGSSFTIFILICYFFLYLKKK